MDAGLFYDLDSVSTSSSIIISTKNVIPDSDADQDFDLSLSLTSLHFFYFLLMILPTLQKNDVSEGSHMYLPKLFQLSKIKENIDEGK